MLKLGCQTLGLATAAECREEVVGEQPVLLRSLGESSQKKGGQDLGEAQLWGHPTPSPAKLPRPRPSQVCVPTTAFHLRSPWDALTDQESGAAVPYYNYQILLYNFSYLSPLLFFFFFFFKQIFIYVNLTRRFGSAKQGSRLY